MKPKPITRKITLFPGDAHVGWVLYVEDYERAVKAMADVIYSREADRCARAALKAIGIVPPKKTKGAK